MVFIGTVLATGPECIINIYVILGRRNLFEMGAHAGDLLAISGEASPTFGHANANFSVFINSTRNQFLKKLIMIII